MLTMMTWAEVQEGSAAVLQNNYFYFAHGLLVFRSLFLYLHTQQDLLGIPLGGRPEDIQTRRKASLPLLPCPRSSPHLPAGPAQS